MLRCGGGQDWGVSKGAERAVSSGGSLRVEPRVGVWGWEGDICSACVVSMGLDGASIGRYIGEG